MNIYIDEAGTFVIPRDKENSVSCGDIVKLRVRGEIFSGDMLHPIYKFNAG
jgi:hypothetical protein